MTALPLEIVRIVDAGCLFAQAAPLMPDDGAARADASALDASGRERGPVRLPAER